MKIPTSITTLISVVLVVILSLGSSNAQVIYVSQGETGHGSSWQDATGDLRAALASAQAGDEVRISGGTYTPTSCSPCTFADRDIRFVLPKGVKLIGGFVNTQTSGGGNGTPSNQVFLSGQIDPADNTTRSFTVLESIAPTSGTVIERINFENGLANDSTRGASNRGASGALLHVTTTDTTETMRLEVNSCNFENGEAISYGGAVFVDADDHKKSKLLFSDCVFKNNIAGAGGGGIAISSNFGGFDSTKFKESTFESNSSGDEGGGGLLLRAAEGGKSNASFEYVYFDSNSAIDGNGGGLRLYGKNGDCSPTITKCDFYRNTAHFGGALTIEGHYNGISNPIINVCDFTSNESTNAGGAIYASAIFGGTTDFEIYKSYFWINESGESGGAVLVNAIEGSSRALYRDVEFWSNTATLYGGAVYNLGKSGVCSPTLINCILSGNEANSAGGMYCLGSEGGESSPLILNCVFSDNMANVGGALYSNANDSTGTAAPFVANTVFQGNIAGNGRTLRTIYGRPQFLNCCFDEADCASLASGSGGVPVCLTGNLFDETADLFTFERTDPIFTPLSDGPLIDAGNDSVLIANGVFLDLNQNARFRGNQVDIGVTESPAESITWNLTVDSTEVSACLGSSVTLGAAIYPPYPTSDINWIVGSDTVSQGSSYTIDELTASQTIQVSGALFGESRSIMVTVNAIPAVETSLTTDALSLPDTLCIDSTYMIKATVNGVGANYFLQWLDQNQNILSDAEVLLLNPMMGPSITRTVVVNYAGVCLDTSSRFETYDFDVANCMISSTKQAIDFESLTLFPNPVRDIVSVHGLHENGPFEVQILTPTGQTVYSGTMSASDRTLNVYSLPQGLYFLIIQDRQTIYRVFLEKV